MNSFNEFSEKIFCICTFLIFSISSLIGQKNKDTIFLFKKNDQFGYHSVFITGPNSSYHNKLFDYLDPDANIKKANLLNKHTYIHFSNSDFINSISGDWISVHRFNDSIYAYLPSEPFYNSFIRVTDSAIWINDFNDGFVPLRIIKIKKTKNKFRCYLKDPESKSTIMDFNIQKNAFASINIMKYDNAARLYIKRNLFNQLPIIVNYCPEQRCVEFNF